MLGYLMVIIFSGAPAAAQEKAPPPAVSVSSSAVAVSTAALSGPELKRLRNSRIASLRKKHAAEIRALENSMKGRPASETRREIKKLRAAHERALAGLKAGHEKAAQKDSAPGKVPVPAAEKKDKTP